MSFNSRITSLSPDHFYLDLTMFNNDQVGNKDSVFLNFAEQRDIPILDDPELWHLSVVRFHLDTPNLPLMQFPVQERQSNINLGTYSITLKYQTFTAQAFLIFVPINQNVSLPKPPLLNQDLSNSYYEIYSYSYFIGLVNTAFQSAYNSLLSQVALPSTVAPYFEWDPTSLRAILNADILGYDLSLPNPIEIYMNGPLFYLFSSFDSFYLGPNQLLGTNFKLNVKNINNGNIYSTTSPAINWLQVYQEYPTLGVLSNPVDSLVFVTTQIPVTSSIQSRPQIYNSTFGDTQVNTNQKTLNILTDLQVGLDLGYETKPSIQFNPTAEYRLISLQSNQPLKSYDISVYWKDASSNFYPFYLAPGSASSMKILFRKKGYMFNKSDF